MNKKRLLMAAGAIIAAASAGILIKKKLSKKEEPKKEESVEEFEDPKMDVTYEGIFSLMKHASQRWIHRMGEEGAGDQDFLIPDDLGRVYAYMHIKEGLAEDANEYGEAVKTLGTNSGAKGAWMGDLYTTGVLYVLERTIAGDNAMAQEVSDTLLGIAMEEFSKEDEIHDALCNVLTNIKKYGKEGYAFTTEFLQEEPEEDQLAN